MKKGSKLKLKATITPKNATQKTIAWSSSKAKVATVSKTGQVKAKTNGTTTIIAKIKGTNKKASCKITVGVPVRSVKLSQSTKQLKVGEKFKLKATVSPAKATLKTVDFKSSNKNIVDVTKSGQVTAKKVGKATITVTTKDGTNKKATCKIEVVKQQDKNQKVKQITLNKTTLEFYTDSDPVQLEAKVLPENAVNKKITWTSNDKEIAEVSSNGLVTPGQKTGTTTVTATAADGSGVKATCKITVKMTEEEEENERKYGDLKITNIQINDFVKEATVYNRTSHIKMKIAIDDMANNLDKIVPEIKDKNAKYKIEYNEGDNAYHIIISNDNLKRDYDIYCLIDYGNKYVVSFEKNDNVTSYKIGENEIYLYMKRNDLSKEDVLKTIKPQMAASTVEYKIVYNEQESEYRMILTDEDGSSRYYTLYAETDNSKNNIISMKSSDPRVEDISFETEDIGNCIYIKSTAESLDDIKDTFTYELGEEVASCSGIYREEDQEEGDAVIILTSKYGGTNKYTVIYERDYKDLKVSKITSKDQNVVADEDIEIWEKSINIYVKNKKEDTEYIVNNYLDFQYGRSTITGKLVKVGDDDYKYVITDNATNETREYRLDCWTD